MSAERIPAGVWSDDLDDDLSRQGEGRPPGEPDPEGPPFAPVPLELIGDEAAPLEREGRGAFPEVAESPELNGAGPPSPSLENLPLRSKPLAWEPLSAIEMRSIVFLDKPLWQADAFHLVAGRKGVGKGTALADLAARVTRGELGAKRRVVWIGSEDSASVDIKPRVVAAGGDPERIAIVTDWIQLPRDIERLSDTIDQIGDVGLVIIDPVGNHITGKNSNSDTDIRDAIAPLNDLADKHGCMLVGIRHLTEKDAKAGAISAILGASAWVQVPRAVIGIARDDDDASISHIQCILGNRLPPDTPGRSFRITGVSLPELENEVTRAVWIGDSSKNIETLIGSKANADRIPAARVQKLILAELAGGETPRRDLDRAAREQFGANPDTVYKSGLEPLREDDRIRARKDGTTGPWLWRLSDAASESEKVEW